MPILHATNTWNVESSVTRHFIDELALITRPASYLTSYSVVTNRPEAGILTPAFSFDAIPAGSLDRWQGRRADGVRGVKGIGQLDLSCWVSRAVTNWRVQLSIMAAMVRQAYIATSEIRVREYADTVSNPVYAPYLVRFVELEVVQTAPDPNPDIERLRHLISYWWVERAN